MLRLFVEAEAKVDTSRAAIGFEVGFGRGDGASAEELAQEEPVTIALGGGLTVRVAGRIDRIDQVGPSTFEIVDYKTGPHRGGDVEAFLDREQERYRGQLEHYAALLRKLDPRPIRLGLYFPLLNGWREWSP